MHVCTCMCCTNECKGVTCSWLVDIITKSIQLPTSCTCVCTTPQLNEIKLHNTMYMTHNTAYVQLQCVWGMGINRNLYTLSYRSCVCGIDVACTPGKRM